MKVIILAALLTAIFAVKADEILDREWAVYKNSQARNYNAEEDTTRKKIFAENFYHIVQHNKQYEAGEMNFRKGYNNFTDWTPKEVQDYFYPNHKSLDP